MKIVMMTIRVLFVPSLVWFFLFSIAPRAAVLVNAQATGETVVSSSAARTSSSRESQPGEDATGTSSSCAASASASASSTESAATTCANTDDNKKNASANDGGSTSTTTTTNPNADETNNNMNSNNKLNAINSNDNKKAKKQKEFRWKTGTLKPSDIPRPVPYSDFDLNATMTLPNGRKVDYADGTVVQINKMNEQTLEEIPVSAEVSVLSQVLPRDNITEMLSLLRGFDLDEDPDTVDGMPSYEIFLSSSDRENDEPSIKELDSHPDHVAKRAKLRAKLRRFTQPILDEIVTPFIRTRHANVCNTTAKPGEDKRRCTPCYSLIRRYRYGSRQSHPTHHDAHAIVTAVISLSDYGREYLGGLYVSTGHGQRQFLALGAGDAAVHKSTLLHGVQVLDLPPPDAEKTERWSWILWYRDSESCQDYSHTWFRDCAEAGNPVCQQLHADKDGDEHRVKWNTKAAEGGSGGAAIKIARAYLKSLPSDLPFDTEKAAKYFQIAIDSHNPEGHYGMAHLLIAEASTIRPPTDGSDAAKQQKAADKQHELLQKALRHLERAAMHEHVYSMFNLGMAHVYGYGTPNRKVDMELGTEWFVRSGMPEGYFVASHFADSIGDEVRRNEYAERARILGYDRPWRKAARQHTGSGGAAGIDLNLPWPISLARGGQQPPQL